MVHISDTTTDSGRIERRSNVALGDYNSQLPRDVDAGVEYWWRVHLRIRDRDEREMA